MGPFMKQDVKELQMIGAGERLGGLFGQARCFRNRPLR